MHWFSSGTGVHLGHCIIFCYALGCPPPPPHGRLALFSHDGKLHNLNFNSKCAFWIKIRKTVVWTGVRQNHIAMRNLRCAVQMMIRMTVFWTVCTPNHIAISNLKCAIQMMVRTMIWIAHFKLCTAMWFGVHTVQNTVFWILIQNAHFKFKFKLRTFALVWKQSRRYNILQMGLVSTPD